MTSYRRSVLSYVDVLGFRRLVEERAPSDVAQLLARFESHCAAFFDGAIDELSYVAFSDLLVRVSPLSNLDDPVEVAERATTEASDLAAAQLVLSQRGILVRGVITLGDVFVHRSTIFGPALIRGYELERDVAVHPRIVVDPELVEYVGLGPWIDDPMADGEDFPSHVMELGQYCSRDTDGHVFIDYLRALPNLGADGTLEAEAETGVLFANHKRTVLAGLSSPHERVRAKYEWLAAYHNSSVPAGYESLRVLN